MAESKRGRVGLGRVHSPRQRSASAIASQESQQKRRQRRARKWRDRFRKFALSGWQSNRIVQGVCDFFRNGAEAARAVRASTGSQVVGIGYGRSLFVEPLESRQMLSAVPFSGSYTQHFDTLPASGTNVAWVNDATINAWSLFNKDGSPIATINAGTGSSATGSFYSFGTSSERALGGVGTGTAYFGSPASGQAAGYISVALQNTTGVTINTLELQYTGEQWRDSGNASPQEMELEYGFGASFATVSSWTAPGGTLDFTSPTHTGTAGALNGNVPANRVSAGGNLTSLNWTNGSTLWVRWIERNDTDDDHGLAIDNVSFSTPSAPPLLTANTGITIFEGGSRTISRFELSAHDVNQSPAQLTYTLLSSPANGTLAKGGVPLSNGSTFTQADINSYSITYTHDDEETTSDGFNFTVDDGAGGLIGSTAFAISITPIADEILDLVSEGFGTTSGNNGSFDPSISEDGRYVVFASNASNLVIGDTNGTTSDIFLKDLQTGAVTLVSANGATQGNNGSHQPAISADGRYVTFYSHASNLVGSDANGTTADIFVKDLQTGTMTLVSANGATQGNNNSHDAAISANGRYVTFRSHATNLVGSDANGTAGDIFVKDLQTGTLTLVSANGATQGNSDSINPSISADGRYVAFYSHASNLVGSDANGTTADIFVKDLQTGTMTLVSANGATQGNNGSFSPSISANGRFVAFYSHASNLVGSDANGTTDIFVKDLQTGTVTLVSVNGATQGNNNSINPAISADGRYVAFYSHASNLVGSDANGTTADIFVKDLQTSTLTLVSANGATQGNNSSLQPSISADGRYVAFYSHASNLVGSDNNGGNADIFVKDLQTQQLDVASGPPLSNSSSNHNSFEPSISEDGRYVVFASDSSNLVINDTNGVSDIFLKDLQTGIVSLVSANGATQGNNSSHQPAISADGRYVTFYSHASNLVGSDANGTIADIFVKDLQTGALILVSANGGTPANNSSHQPAISADGRYVTFYSHATNLVGSDANGTVSDIFRKDLLTGTVTLVSANGATQGNNSSHDPSISADGRYVAFYSHASNFIGGDVNGTSPDIFVKDLQTGALILVSANGATQGNNSSLFTSISADGRYVTFQSLANNLVPGDTNGVYDVFVKDLQTGQISRISVDENGVQGNSHSELPAISPDGRYVSFTSHANNLVPGDINGVYDIFVKDRQTGEIRRVNVTDSGVQANSGSWWSSISADAGRVAFESDASNLHPGDGNFSRDIYVFTSNTSPIIEDQWFSVAEDDDGTSSFATVVATDTESAVEYEIIDGSGMGLFEIDEDTGELSVASSLDFETATSYTLEVRVTDAGLLSDTAIITVNVTAVNDNSPIFTAGPTQTLTIVENSGNGTVVGSAAATDADQPPESLTYDILSGAPMGAFAIDASGQITISDASLLDLDFENAALVAQLTIEVSDGSNTAQQVVDVNVSAVNDIFPIFTAGASQTLTVVENSGNGTVVGSAAATDADQPPESLTYDILSGAPMGAFAIDSNGQITISDASLLDLDFEDGALVAVLTVEVSDGTNTAEQEVTVNVSAVNDNSPIFTAGPSQTLTIAENSGNSTVVGSAAATDADVPADSLTYDIVGGDPNNGFAIDANGQITIADASQLELDFENGALVATLTVEVSDGTNAALQEVTVNVSALNDNTPIFTAGAAQTLTIFENSLDGTVVGSAAATDADLPPESLTYDILSGAPVGAFAIDSNGQITINDASLLDLDFENGALVAILTIEVSDGTNTAEQEVTVNVSAVNDNNPIFNAGASQTLTIAENSLDGTVVGSAAATDADVPTDSLTYDIVGGDPNDGFAIDASGQITIADASQLELDFENGALVATLTIEVSDGTNTAQQEVTVNVSAVNDNSPIFNAGASQTLTIAENSLDGAVVGSAAATDADLPPELLSYTIAAGDPNGGFAIDASGQITIADASQLDLDYENGALVATLTIEVSDGTNTTQQEVTVNVFDVTEQVAIDAALFATANGEITIKVDGGLVIAYASSDLSMTPLFPPHAVGSISDLVITGRDGFDDTLTVLFSGGNPIPPGGISYNGGAGGSDSLVVVGSGSESALYTPDSSEAGAGTVAVDGLAISFTGLEPVDISGMATATVASPANATNSLVLTAGFDNATGTVPAIVVSGNTGLGMTQVETAHLFNNTNVVIDTSATSGGANTITVSGAIASSHANTNISLQTNGDGQVTFNGDIAASGLITLDTPVVNLNSDVVVAGKTTTAAVITFNVDNAPTGKIQDAVDLATNGDDINVLAGTYNESVTIANKSIDVLGAGPSLVTLTNGAISTPLLVTGVGTVVVDGMTIAGGIFAVDLDSATLTLRDVAVTGGSAIGVLVDNNGSLIVEDSLLDGSGLGTGVAVVDGSADITGSILRDRTDGLVVGAAGTATLHDNDLSGGMSGFGNFAIQANPSAGVIDASSNWWGTNDENAVQASVQGQIDFTPFLDSGANSATGVGFAGDFSYLHVTALGDQTAGGRIQEGVDAVTAGGIVNVLQGTFIDNVEVDKSVEIMGAGQGLTTVLPSFVGANTGGGSIAPGSSNVFLVQADNVTIHDLTIDGNNSDLTSGVLSNGVDVDARNGIITDHTLGVFNALDVHDVTVKNIYLRGIYASSGGTFSFVGNTVDNVAGEAASIAIFNFGGSGLIQGNIVSNANDAIAANHSKGTQFLNNIVTNSGSGIHTDNNGSSGGVADVIQGNQVSNGSIPGGSYGIFVFVPYLDVTVVGNTVSNVDVGLGLFGGQGGSATFTGNSVDTANRSGSVGAWVTTDTFGFGQMNASATFDGNNDISNADTGILIEQGLGAVTEVEITGNAASIHGNAIGIDVAGGSADISGNHIYDNTTGIRFTNGGSGSVDGNNFEGGAGDNVTDLRLDADAGAIVGGALTGNTFAGSTYFIDNRSAQDLTALRSPHGDNFYNIGGAPTSDDFAIEGRIFHEVDNAASGLVTWVPNTIFVTPTSTPTASDNDYTRIANALGAASAGDTILLGPNGGDATFNWDENFALASWELGNDGLAGTDDDWGANLPVGLSNVTITADIADGVTIHGPGDLASTSLETGFLAYNTGAHQNVTISNFTIEGIANAIGIYYTGGADFSGLTIENMHISVPVDDPSDGFHNIGIHYAFGQDIKIQNNTIDLVDGGADSFSVGVQSNTHTTSDYDDLEITGNVITVTGDGDGGIIGIWENGHAHASDMMIAGNTFQGAGNPTTNDQTAFVITSHSGATTAVKYFGNIIDNAQVGFEWLDEYDGDPINYTGTQAVQLTNNALTDVNTGVMVGGINGSALLSNNSLINSGAMLHVGIGVDVAAGASATIDGSPNENSIVGFNVGISSAGTLFVMDNDASIHGNVTGIAVTGGAATITNNHIYDNTTGIDVTGGSAAISGNSIHLNTTGIRFATTGAGSVAGNTFDNASDDNLTDLLIESSAGTVTIGAGNFFAGNDYFIDNRSTQSFDLFGANAQGYQGSLGVLNAGTLADDFRIEDHMFHGPDNGTSGVIYWVENTMFVTTPGTGDNDETIQQAIDTATAGDTINVEAGEYDEQVVINKSLTLQGAGNSTVIKPSSAATLTSIYNTGTQVGANFNNRNLGGVVQVSGVGTAGVTLRNLKIDAENVTAVPAGATEGVGLIFGETAGLIQNVTVEDIDSIPLSVRSHGMWINAVGGAAVNVEVDNATVNGYSRTGILSRGNELTVDIHDSDVTGPGTVGPAAVPNGITLIDTAHGSVTNNVISAGHHVGTSALTAGILLFDAADGVMIQGNEVFDYDDGIIINDSDLAVVQGNNFHDNLKGIRIEAGANNNNITGNTITNSSQFGIELGTTAGTGNTLTSNIISATSGVGINLLGGSVSFGAGNTVTGGATGLAVNGATTAIVGNTLNDIAFTGQSDFYVSVTGGALDNVEIDGTAASFGGVVGGGTLAQSFAIEDKLRHALDDSAVGHLRFKANEVFVTTPGTGLSDETVANAVAAAVSGDTIYVQSGTYTDTAQIVIDKNLNIIGEGKTSTIFTKNFDTGASGDPRGWWLVNPGVALNLSHVGFDGTGQLTWQAIRHKGSGTIDNVGFTEIKFNPSGPDYAGTAIVPLAGSSVTVSNSMFSQIGRVGVLFFGAGATGTFQGNTYTGKGVGDWLDYGVEVGAGAVVNIIGNSISGNLGVASVDGSTSAGVLVTTFFGPGSEAHFSGANVISGNTTGVHVGFGNTDTSDVTINGGQFIDNTSNGIHIRGASGASLVVDGATVTGNDGAGISAIGVMTAGPEVLIQNTNLTNNGVGIYVDNGAIVDAGLGGNTSLVGTGPAGASAGFNTLTGYTGVSGNYAIEDQNLDTENGDQDVYARNNAFGTTIPAAIEQVVFHTVDDPAVTEVIFTSPIAPPNTPFPPLMVFVDDSWAGTATGADADTPAGGTMGNGQAFGYDQFATIQDGIDAVAAVGGTVYVYAGTYIEAINVHKSLDLISEDAFFSTAAGDGTDDSVINPSGVNSVVVTISAGDVEMAGFTIDGDSVDSYGILATTPFPYPTLTGLEIRHNAVRDLLRRGIQSDTYLAEFDIHHNQVSNITGDAAAIAIFNYGGGGLPGTATIHHNTITGSTVGIGGQQSAGMQVHDNNITMIAGGIGIQDSNPGTGSPPPVGATETFENNIISGGDSTSAGLIVINSAMDVLIKGNTVTTPGLGLGAFGSYSPSTITFDDNTVLADDIGIQISTDTLGLNGFQDVTAIIQNDNDISGAATGILVEELGGAVADVTITGNDDSIHGNAVGIDVVGGTVTISNNDIYDNGIGVRLSNATGDLTDNNIDSNYVGISVLGASTLTLTGGTIDDNESNGLIVVGDGVVKQTIVVSGTSFSSNSTGKPVSAGHGDITLFDFAAAVADPSTASFTDVTITSDMPDYAIQVRGVAGTLPFLNGSTTAEVTFNNVDILGTQQRFAMLVQQYADLSDFSFTDVTFNSIALGGLVMFDTGGTLDLGDSTFHDTYIAGDGPGNGTGIDIATSLTDVDASGVTFVGADKTTLAGNFAIEDRVGHYIDADASPLTAGFVDWIDDSGAPPFAEAVFVTQESYAPAAGTTTPKIQRGINASIAGYNVYVQGGAFTYAENLTIGKDLNLIGETGNTPNLQSAAGGGNVITIDGSGFGDDETVTVDNFNFNGVSGVGDYGIRVNSTAVFDRLAVSNSSFTGFDFNAIAVFGDLADGISVADVDLTNLTFSNNGLNGGNGTGDVQFFDYNGDATLTNLDMVGSATASTGARGGIQFRGASASGAPGAAGVGVLPMGTIVLNDIDVSGDYRTQMIGFQRYTNSNITFTDVKLGGVGSEITGTFGASLRFDAVGFGSLSSPIFVDLGNTHFRGLDPLSAQRHEIEFAPDNGHTFLRADGDATQWDIGGMTFVAAALTLPQAFNVEDRILHYVDKLNPTHGGTHGPYKGFVDIKPGEAFIGDDINSGLLGDGSIQRGVNIVAAGGTVHVEGGSFTEAVNVNKHVKIIGAGSTGLGATVLTQPVSSDIITITASGASNVDRLLLEGMQLMPVGAGTHGIIITGAVALEHIMLDDVKVTGSSPAGPAITEIGFRIMDFASVNDLVIVDSLFENLNHGMLIEKHLDITGASNVTNLSITNTGFEDNQSKGFYAEKLSDATFTDVWATGNGNLPFFVSGAGIEINLKGSLPTYENLVFNNLTVTNNGLGTPSMGVPLGAGLQIKARGTGGDTGGGGAYAANPALLDDVEINGGTFTGNRTGIRIGEPGQLNTSPTNVVIDGVTVTGSTETGINVVGGVATIQDSTLTNNPTGILVNGAGRAIIINNLASITGGNIGIDVNGANARALVENTYFDTNQIGVRIQNGGLADLGQLAGAEVDYTGLGESAGLNDFTSYTTAASATNGAIVNLNTGGAYSNAGQQGHSGPEHDVEAFNNLFDNSNPIDTYIWHDADSTALGFVDYGTLADLTVSFQPLPAIDDAESIDEGSSITVYGSFTNDAQAHTVTISWGDGSPDTVLNLDPGEFTFSATTLSGTYDDDPDGAVQSILHNITVTVVETATPANQAVDNSLDVTVNNFVPTIPLADQQGDNTINEGQTFNLVVGPRNDPGVDTISAYTIFWGDGDSTFVSGDPLTSSVVHSHLYADGLIPPTRTITIDVLDDDGTWMNAGSLVIDVNNVNPTAANFQAFNPTVNEGGTTNVFFSGPFVDPGSPDTPFHFAYDFDNDGTFDLGNGTYAGSGTASSAAVPSSFLADDDDSPRTVRGRIIDNDGGFTDYTVNIGINNVAPVVNAGPDTTVVANSVLSHTVTFTDPGADSPWTVSIDWDEDAIFDETFMVPGHSFDIADYSTWTYGPGDVGSTFTVVVQVDDNDGGVDTDTFDVLVVEDTLRVIDFEFNASGFDVTFNRAPNLGDLNLYDSLLDGSSMVLEAPDLTLVRNGSEQILGSIVWAADTNTLSFVKTGGVLADGNYDVTLVSSAIGFHDGLDLLDGDGDFDDSEVGDDYERSFTIDPPPVDNRVVSIGDFSRGTGQDVNVPTVEMGGAHLPVNISDANGVESVDVDILYNHTLLNISDAYLGAGPLAAGGWSITTNFINVDASHTLLKITISGVNAMSGSNVELIKLDADVPSNAPYGASQVVQLLGLRVNEDLIPSLADNAIHKVTYVGDADGSGLYGGGDSTLISRVVVFTDSGFDAHDWTDPQIVGDASGDGTLSGLDASYVAQEAVDIDRPEVPPIPGVMLMMVGGGIDPEYSIDENIPAQLGQSVIVPVKLEVMPGETNMVGGTFVLNYDEDLLTYQSPVAGAGWNILFVNSTQPGVLRVSYQTSDLDPAAVGESVIADLNFEVGLSGTVGEISPIDIAARDPNELGLTWTNDNGSAVITGLPGDYNRNGVVDTADWVVWMKLRNTAVPIYTLADGNGDGFVDDDDYDIYVENFGETFPGAGGGAEALQASADEPLSSEVSSTTKVVFAPASAVFETSEPTADSTVSFVAVASPEAPAVTNEGNASSSRSARDSVLADFAGSQSSGRTAHARPTLRSQHIAAGHRGNDDLLLDLAIAARQERAANCDTAIDDDEAGDNFEALDELFSALDEEKVLLAL